MAMRFFIRRRIKRNITGAKTPLLQTLDDAENLIFLTQIQGNQAVLLLNRLQTKFPDSRSIVLINLNKEKKLTSLRDGRRTLIETGSNSLTFFGGLNSSLYELIKDLNAAVLINTDNYSADVLHLIAASINANMKCGMHNPFELPLYNPLITPEADQSPEEYIETVNSYMKSLTGKK